MKRLWKPRNKQINGRLTKGCAKGIFIERITCYVLNKVLSFHARLRLCRGWKGRWCPSLSIPAVDYLSNKKGKYNLFVLFVFVPDFRDVTASRSMAKHNGIRLLNKKALQASKYDSVSLGSALFCNSIDLSNVKTWFTSDAIKWRRWTGHYWKSNENKAKKRPTKPFEYKWPTFCCFPHPAAPFICQNLNNKPTVKSIITRAKKQLTNKWIKGFF